MMDTMTLTEFLLACIAEDEADPDCAGSCEYSSCRDWSERHEAECVAKRQILDLLGHVAELGGTNGGSIARALAAVYADHPDYRQEWKP